MIARFAGAVLGLLAFAVTIIAGLCVRNPVTVTLSRSILATFVFCVIGLVLGAMIQLVVAEHEKGRRAEILDRYRGESKDLDAPAAEPEAAPEQGAAASV